MVFTSAPVYLDPPNWQQQLNGPQGIGHDNNHPQFPPVPSQSAPMGGGGGGGVGIASSIRPGSLADRARQAKLPQPEQALKCPRCESTNTKFCYFNNYSLTQPRHFCKTCRRYWTRGGALRTVPVGGGCRRNKRSSKSSSKSPGTSDHHHHHQRQNSHSSTSSIPLSNTTTNFMTTSDTSLGHIMTPQSQQHPPHQLPFMASLLNFSTDKYGTTTADHLGLNFSGVNHSPSTTQLGTGGFNFHHMGISTSAGSNNILSSTGSNGEQWRLQQAMQQFPFLSGLEPPRGLYSSFQGSNQQAGVIGNMGHDQSQARTPASPVVTRFASVKTEENEAGGGLNLSRQIMGTNNNNQGNDQYWSGNAWTDLSGFTSSTTSHLL